MFPKIDVPTLKHGFNLDSEKMKQNIVFWKTSCWLLINNRWGCHCKISFNLVGHLGTLRCWGPGPLVMDGILEGLARIHNLAQDRIFQCCFHYLGRPPTTQEIHNSLIVFLNICGGHPQPTGTPQWLNVFLSILGGHPQPHGIHCSLNAPTLVSTCFLGVTHNP